MTLWAQVLGSVLVVSLVSLVGVVVLSWGRAFLDRAVMYLVSLAAGVLLGGAFFHLIPEAYQVQGDSLLIPSYVLAGFLGFFLLERFLWAHHHGHGDEPLPGRDAAAPIDDTAVSEKVPEPRGSSAGEPKRFRPVVVMSLLGDGIHNLIDGMVIAAAYAASPGLGIVTTTAVLLHEVPQEVGEFGVLVRGGLSVRRALFFNFLSASMAFVGAIVTLLVGSGSGGFLEAIVPITAGHFIYIAAADLIPELHHEHDPREAVGQGLLLVVGVLVMVGLRWVGPA
jgi:zinc and cadmium transporter